MRIKIEHRNHRSGAKTIGTEDVDCKDLDYAERDTFRTLCQEAADDKKLHADASMILKDEDGTPLSVVFLHTTVKRL